MSRAPITKPVPVSNNFARGLRKLWERGTRCYRPNTQRLTQTGCILAKVVPSTERFRCPTPWWCARTRRNFPKGVQKARRKMSADPALDRPRRRKYQLLLTANQARRQHRGGSFVDRLSAGAEAAESRSLSKGSQAAEAGRPRFQVSWLVTSGDSGYASHQTISPLLPKPIDSLVRGHGP